MLAQAQFMSPSLRADGKYYDADDEGEGERVRHELRENE